MIITVSQIIVILFGALIGLLSIWGIVAPQKIMKLAKDTMSWDYGVYLAVAVRVLLGAALILFADASRFPVTFQVLGWITILAAVVIAVAGRARLRRFTAWMDKYSPSIIRGWLVVGVAFGGFLVYGAT